MELILHILDYLLYIVFAANVLYLFVYSMASLCRRSRDASLVEKYRHFAILIPAYKEDTVIQECVRSCLAQEYPSDRFDVVVVSDGMRAQTDAALAALPIRIVKVHFEKSTKSKSLNAAMAAIGNNYDIALILDADNVIPPDYLSDINHFFANPKVEIVQTHRIAKNINNKMAFLDAVSEEINNSIFRLGHSNLGMSAALIGSGMAFQYHLFRDVMANIRAVGGFDRELELTLLYQGKKIYYMPDTHVKDEKIQSHDAFILQRRRWLSAQWNYSMIYVRFLPAALAARKWDFCDKLFQQFSIPRLLLIGFIIIFSILHLIFHLEWSFKWWGLFLLLAVSLLASIPRHYYNRRLFLSLLSLPYAFYLMAKNLFNLRGANKTFIHTSHEVKKETEKKEK